MRDEPGRKVGDSIAEDVLDLVGNTPMVRLRRLPPPGAAEIVAKLELFNPGGSVKDRVALHMIRSAEAEGLLDHDTEVIESSSGNTGIGLAMVCAARGYRCTIVMPDSMSLERVSLLRRFGAEVVLTPAAEDVQGAVRKATELARKARKAFVPNQFESRHNPEAHRVTTAREILRATEGRLDAFVAGVGTGGTITGVGRALKEAAPGVRVVAVEPEQSPVLSGGRPGRHRIQGIGAGFIPPVLDRAVIDEVRTVSDRAAFEAMKRLAAAEGILAGISAGAAVEVAIVVAQALGPGRRVVVMLPDTGERYLTTEHYFEI